MRSAGCGPAANAGVLPPLRKVHVETQCRSHHCRGLLASSLRRTLILRLIERNDGRHVCLLVSSLAPSGRFGSGPRRLHISPWFFILHRGNDGHNFVAYSSLSPAVIFDADRTDVPSSSKMGPLICPHNMLSVITCRFSMPEARGATCDGPTELGWGLGCSPWPATRHPVTERSEVEVPRSDIVFGAFHNLPGLGKPHNQRRSPWLERSDVTRNKERHRARE